jgi:FixJ family two-component response regulator
MQDARRRLMCLRLTTRELAVLGLLAARKSNREIADALGISDGGALEARSHRLRHQFYERATQ